MNGVDVFDAIYLRRSIREFQKDKKVPNWMIEKVLDAARYAPSPENVQPWKFIVIRDQESKRFLADMAQETSSMAFGMAKYEMPSDRLWYIGKEARVDVVERMFDGRLFRYPEEADVVILACTSDQWYDIPYVPTSLKEITDMAFAMSIQNMWLACTALGLGAGWDSFVCIGDERRREIVARFFGIPRNWRPITAFCIGWPKRARELGPARYPLEAITFEEYWGRPYVREALRKKK